MAYRLFDQRVVNPLERPVSEDPNAGFSQDSGTLRDMLQQLFAAYPVSAVDTDTQGFIGEGFRPYTPVGRTVGLAKGLGFRYAPDETQAAIGGVAGVSDMAAFKPLYLRETRPVIDVPAAPSSSTLARRDILAVRWSPHLADALPSRVFNTGTQSFSLTNKLKTLSWDLYDYAAVALSAGGSTDPGITDPILYVPGVASAYTPADPDSILTCPLPEIPDTYTPIAIINVKGGASTISAADVVDYRRHLFPGGVASILGNPTIGSSDVLGAPIPGRVLTNATLVGPYGFKAFLTKDPVSPPQNRYKLVVIGARSARALTLQAVARMADPSVHQPVSINIVDQVLSGVASSADCAAWSDSFTTPDGGTFAIGQPYSSVSFTVGAIEQVDGSTTLNKINPSNQYWDTIGVEQQTIQLMLQATLLT